MVKSANMNGLLDSDSDSLSSCQHRVKARLHEILQKDREFIEEDYERVMTQLYNTIISALISLYHLELKNLLVKLTLYVLYFVTSCAVFSFFVAQLAPTCSASLVNSMKTVQNPVATCDKVYALIQSLTSQIRKRMEDPKSAGELIPESCYSKGQRY